MCCRLFGLRGPVGPVLLALVGEAGHVRPAGRLRALQPLVVRQYAVGVHFALEAGQEAALCVLRLRGAVGAVGPGGVGGDPASPTSSSPAAPPTSPSASGPYAPTGSNPSRTPRNSSPVPTFDRLGWGRDLSSALGSPVVHVAQAANRPGLRAAIYRAAGKVFDDDLRPTPARVVKRAQAAPHRLTFASWFRAYTISHADSLKVGHAPGPVARLPGSSCPYFQGPLTIFGHTKPPPSGR